MNQKIKIQDIEVEITKVYQMITYDSLIEGTLNKELNDDTLIDIKQRATRIFYRDDSYIIDPRVNDDDDFPEYCIILELLVFNTYKDLDKDYSNLTVICFQDTFALPLSPKNTQAITQIPFKSICQEYYI
jgi:hypothetical protein